MIFRNLAAFVASSLVVILASSVNAAVIRVAEPGDTPVVFPPPLSFEVESGFINTLNIFLDTEGQDVFAIEMGFQTQNVVGDWDVFLELPRGGEWEAECDSNFDGTSGSLTCFGEKPANGLFNLGFFEIIRTNDSAGDNLDLTYAGGSFMTEPITRGPGGSFGNPAGSTMATYVPEPTSLALLGLGILGAARMGRHEPRAA